MRLPGDFNLFFNPGPEASGGKPVLKKKINSKICGNIWTKQSCWYLGNLQLKFKTIYF